MLKISVFVYLRFCLPLLPFVAVGVKIFCSIFLIFSILVSSFQMFHHLDLKRIIAFSSIVHMNICFLGLLCNKTICIIGSLYYMFGHAFVASALFFCVGYLYERVGFRNIFYYQSLSLQNPYFSFFFFFLFSQYRFPLFL
jgi:NADH:ubiquinone oxidoreductase subunit 4 (subunit M)